MKTKQELKRLVYRWQRADLELRMERGLRFREGAVVWVDCLPKYRGFGLVRTNSATPTDMVAVEMEGFVVWNYPVETVDVARVRRNWPNWVRQRRSHERTAKSIDRAAATIERKLLRRKVGPLQTRLIPTQGRKGAKAR